MKSRNLATSPNFNEFGYLTDTGRCWNGEKVSIRDKIQTKNKVNYKTTNDIINAIRLNEFPDKILMTFHPQRLNDNFFQWIEELMKQKIKNTIKYFVVSQKNRITT